MLTKIWELLSARETLIEDAQNSAFEMLAMGKEMFMMAIKAVKEEADIQVRKQVGRWDRKINEKQIEVRKEVYEHLALSRAGDLMMGLQLTNIVIDLERIGDYTKNIGELVDMLPGQLHFNEFEDIFNDVVKGTIELFDLTREALTEESEEKAFMVFRNYDRISKLCDNTLKKILTSEEFGEADSIKKELVGFLLLLRYVKRISAHLKNVSSSVVHPFHKFGYRIGV